VQVRQRAAEAGDVHGLKTLAQHVDCSRYGLMLLVALGPAAD
jgi:hypothetical protein